MSSHDNDVPFLPIYSLSFATYSIDSSYITSDSSQHSSMSSGLNDEIGENDETNSEEKLEPASDNERKLVKIFASIDLEEMNSETDQRQFSETFQPFSNVGVDGGGEANHDNNKENDDMRVAETMRRTKSLKITQPLRSKENKQKKMVRFADSFGLDLELVHIIQVEDPFGNDTKLLNKRLENKLKFKESSIFTSLSNQPIISVNLPPYESKELKESNENGKSEKRKRQNYSSKSSSSDTKENAELRFAIYTKPVCHLVPKHVWKTSNSSYVNEKVLHNFICLCSFNTNNFRVGGKIKVLNLHYNKKVIVRYTLNNWLSYIDESAHYIEGSHDGATDLFQFSILIPFYFSSFRNDTLEFCLSYKTNGQIYWDNNSGKNYVLVCC